jgi:hypothetical protein
MFRPFFGLSFSVPGTIEGAVFFLPRIHGFARKLFMGIRVSVAISGIIFMEFYQNKHCKI